MIIFPLRKRKGERVRTVAVRAGGWRIYQHELGQNRRVRRFRSGRFAFYFALLVLLALGLTYRGQGRKQAAEPVSASNGGVERVVQTALTLNPDLQEMIRQMFLRVHPPYAAAVAMDVESGAVLAMVGVSDAEKDQDDPQLTLRSIFPAASIFKLVSAAAAVEERGLPSSTTLYTVGNPYALYREKMSRIRSSRAQPISLAEALAKSNNVAFADLTQRFLNRTLLEGMAVTFGFNREIPYELPVEMSEVVLKGDAFDVAKASTGLGEHTLSPIHAALIAAAIANEGKAHVPFLTRSGNPSQGVAAGYFIDVEPKTALSLQGMMEKTITQGTARKTFRGFQGLTHGNLEIAGKTGSLTAKNLKGKCDWFMGYMKGRGQNMAVAVVMVHRPVWHIKSSYVARKIFEYTLKTPTSVAARRTESI